MSLYTDVRDGVFTWTNRPLMIADTNLAIRQALRAAHRAGKFYKDLQVLPITGLSTTDMVQQIDLSAVAPNYRMVNRVFPTGRDMQYDPVAVTDLFDADKYPRTDVYYGIGNSLMIRALQPTENVTLEYFRNPTVTPIENMDSWIAQEHQDLIILWAAATVLTLIGESEIKSRVDALAKIEYMSLIGENLMLGAS